MKVDAVVLGYGQVGMSLTTTLQSNGQRARVVSRSGSGPVAEGIERIQADVSDPHQAARAIGDAPVIYLCTHHATYAAKAWARALPQIQQAVLNHAKASGAVVVVAENLYAFRADGAPITSRTPLEPRSRKGTVRRDLIVARERSGARVVSVAAGDFYGPATYSSHAGERLMKPLLTGSTVSPVGNVDLPHAYTYVPDLARAMVKASTVPGSGHEIAVAPSAGDITTRELIKQTAQVAGVPAPPIRPVSARALHALGLVIPQMRELADVAYQFTEPFTVDTDDDEARLGMSATPWEQAAVETATWWRNKLGLEHV